MQLKPQDQAPNFKLLSDENQEVALSDFAGKNLVIYFYPKDSTPGCTIESKDFTELSPEFNKLNTVILGVSKDSIASHQKFKSKHNFPFLLLSDPEGKMCEAYGAWGEKSMFGKKYMGIIRSTFLINSQGKIHQSWYKVKVKNHAQQVLETAQSMLTT